MLQRRWQAIPLQGLERRKGPQRSSSLFPKQEKHTTCRRNSVYNVAFILWNQPKPWTGQWLPTRIRCNFIEVPELAEIHQLGANFFPPFISSVLGLFLLCSNYFHAPKWILSYTCAGRWLPGFDCSLFLPAKRPQKGWSRVDKRCLPKLSRHDVVKNNKE